MRFLVWKDLRREDLCPGPRDCHAAKTVRCLSCGTVWKPFDIRDPDACPQCGAQRKYKRERCGACELTRLEESMAACEAGQLLSFAADLDYRLQKRFAVHPSDTNALIYRTLRMLDSERARYQKEKDRERRQH